MIRGIGIPEDKIGLRFDKFSQVDISKQFVELMRGEDE